MLNEKIFFVLFYPLIVFAGSFFIAIAFRKTGYYLLSGWAKRANTEVDNAIITSTRYASILWCVILSLYLAIEVSPVHAKYIGFSNRVLSSLIIISFTIAGANLAVNLFSFCDRKNLIPMQLTGLSKTLSKVIILAIGFLILLSNLGISIAPLLTALGVGGLAVALALQDTLANFFAGVHLLIEKPIRIGDFIRLETGEEGYVVDISWRTTRIKMLSNNILIVPNSKLSQSRLINYCLPEKKVSATIRISVSCKSNPEKVERILVDEAMKAAEEIPELLKDPKPTARFIPGFMDSSFDFTLGFEVREFSDQFFVQHELRKRIFKRFNEEGIEIPFPTRTIYMKDEKQQ